VGKCAVDLDLEREVKTVTADPSSAQYAETSRSSLAGW
jgi:hypothetical protein